MLIFSSILAVAFIALLARWSPVAEIVTHFRMLYALGAAFALICFLLACAWRWALAAAVLLIWQGWAIVPWLWDPNTYAQFEHTKLTVVSVNVNADTTGYEKLLDVIADEDPDLIFVQELSPLWAKALEVIHEEYPYRIITARMDYFGLGFYSRYPIENVDSSDPLNSDVPISRGDVVVGNQRLHIVNAHLAPPEGRMLTEMRYDQFTWLTEYVERLQGPVIVAGDFNCTMWSPLYHDLVERGRLTNARYGRGIMPSWFPMPGGLNLIPIDQILGRQLLFTSMHLGERIGSDHVPLVATLELRKSPV